MSTINTQRRNIFRLTIVIMMLAIFGGWLAIVENQSTIILCAAFIFSFSVWIRKKKSYLETHSFHRNTLWIFFELIFTTALFLCFAQLLINQGLFALLSRNIEYGIQLKSLQIVELKERELRPKLATPPASVNQISGRTSENESKLPNNENVSTKNIEGQGNSNEIEQVRNEISSWGTLFSWLIAAVGLMLTFLTGWIYNIAKDTREHADRVDASLELNHKMRDIRFDLARITFHTACGYLRDDMDSNDHRNERDGLAKIRAVAAMAEKLLEPMANLDKFHEECVPTLAALRGIGAKELEDRYKKFLMTEFANFLVAVHTRLQESDLPNTDLGQSCINDIAALWRFSRGED